MEEQLEQMLIKNKIRHKWDLQIFELYVRILKKRHFDLINSIINNNVYLF